MRHDCGVIRIRMMTRRTRYSRFQQLLTLRYLQKLQTGVLIKLHEKRSLDNLYLERCTKCNDASERNIAALAGTIAPVR